MELREKIIVEAAELFHQFGIRSVSMDDIARQLSISKKTIYQYFKDKNEIVKLSLQLHLDQKKVEYDNVFKSSVNAIDELVKVSTCMRQDFKDMNPSLLYDLQKYHPDCWSIWQSFKNEYIKDHIQENFSKGIEEGYYREGLVPEVLARMRVEQVQLAFDEQIFPKNQYDLKELQLQFFDHFVHGVVTEKGRKLYLEYIQNIINQESPS